MRKLFKLVFSVFLLLSWFVFGNEILAAEGFPTKPIKFVIGIGAGGDADIQSRTLAQKASAVLGQPIVIVNKPGAGSSIGYREIHDAKPDGYTIGWGGIPLIVGKLTGIHPLDYHDFTLIGMYYTMYLNVFGSAKTRRPFNTIQEVISFAKSHPGEVSMATGSVGNLAWVASLAFQEGTGLQLNIIPQPGAGEFVATQLGGGHTDLGVAALSSMKPQIDAGNTRFLAILGSQRSPAYKDVTTLKELGYDVQVEACGFVMGPPKMPKDILDKLAKAFEIAANDPEYQKFLHERLVSPFYLPPEKIVPYLDKQRNVISNTMKKAGILKEK